MKLMNKIMFNVHRSNLNFRETVAALKKSAPKHGWDIPMVHDLQENYQNAGYEDMTRVTTLYFCHPDGGYRILQDDAYKPMGVMMPMGVSVYETSNGEVYIAAMNLGRMSMMFGSPVKEVLREGATNYAATLEGIATPEADEAIEVDSGRCCLGCGLGCVSLTAVAAALIGVIVFIMTKLMPKIVATMIPKMMGMMEEAGVQPPCAQIILEHLDETQTAE